MADTDTTGEQSYQIEALVGMQVKTSRFMKKKEETDLVQNGQYDELGSIGKKLGYAQRGDQLTSSTSTSSSTTTTTSTSSSTSTTTTSTSTS
jgi:hypothetical protein